MDWSDEKETLNLKHLASLLNTIKTSKPPSSKKRDLELIIQEHNPQILGLQGSIFKKNCTASSTITMDTANTAR